MTEQVNVWVDAAPDGDNEELLDALGKMQALDGPTMEFTFTRDPEPGRTFSAGAVRGLATLMTGWTLSRLHRSITATPQGHSRLRVRVTVEVE